MPQNAEIELMVIEDIIVIAELIAIPVPVPVPNNINIKFRNIGLEVENLPSNSV
ncbi:2026_t:CDS:1, partial [Ambispora gerdemannii]